MKEALVARLAQLAAQRQTITYGQLARDLGLTGPSTIARLTAALEALMEEDAAQGKPLRAALLSGRLARDMPAPGFFAKASDLGVFDGVAPEAFLLRTREALFQQP